MRLIFLATAIILCSCKSKKEIIADRQQAIQKEMKNVNAFYYKKIDSLDNIKKTDTSSARLLEIAKEISSTDAERSAKLLKFQNEYDSLQAELK